MSLKVFTQIPIANGYVGDPPLFYLDIPFRVCQSDGGDDNAPRFFDSQITLHLPVGTTTVEALTNAYNLICEECSAHNYPTPALADVFAAIPMSLAQVFGGPLMT